MYVRKVDGVLQPPTKRQSYGKIFEEAILYCFCEETGKKFRPSFNKTFQHPDQKYHLVATPDGLPEDESDGGVDCKLTAWDQRHQWGPTADDIPPRVELQVRGCMAVMNKPRWYVAVWCGDRLLTYTIERDLEFEGFILDRAEREWRKYFEAKVRPPIGGSKISAAWLQQAYPTHNRPDIRPATDAEIELLARYGKLRNSQKTLIKERLELENKLKDAIKDREGLEWPGGRFTWRRAKDSRITNWEGLALTMMSNFVRLKDGSKDEETWKKLLEDHTWTKPGSRRIWFSSDENFAEEEAAATDAA
jgi:predicted phage-related endonuclease